MTERYYSANVGFIGLGNMGNCMAANLLKKGHKLQVYDVSPAAVDAVQKMGAEKCASAAEVAKKSDYVVTMLPNNAIVLDCYKGMIGDAKKDTLFLDSSTIDPAVAKEVRKLVNEHQSEFCDAPVSGGVPGAAAGTLCFMVGGDTKNLERARPVLEAMGSKITHCGDTGMGQAAKICNNMLLAISMIGVSECMNLGKRLGLDPKTLMDIVNASTGRCWSSEVYNPVPGLVPTAPASHNYDGGFMTKLMHKDLGLASGVASATLTPIPLGTLAHQLFTTVIAHGLGDKDFSVIYDFIQEQGKKK
uniref:3-hydroxyisobutyrate dehydrogenase n=1 Tax=Xenopsylla cheopis TaxID=163159 RepID=A0A6M2DM99_XENCH